MGGGPSRHQWPDARRAADERREYDARVTGAQERAQRVGRQDLPRCTYRAPDALLPFTDEDRFSRIAERGFLAPSEPALNPWSKAPAFILRDTRDGLYYGCRMDPPTRRYVPVTTGYVEAPLLEDILPPDHDLGPLVVWLTREPRIGAQLWRPFDDTDGYASGVVRILVDVSDAQLRWSWRSQA